MHVKMSQQFDHGDQRPFVDVIGEGSQNFVEVSAKLLDWLRTGNAEEVVYINDVMTRWIDGDGAKFTVNSEGACVDTYELVDTDDRTMAVAENLSNTVNRSSIDDKDWKAEELAFTQPLKSSGQVGHGFKLEHNGHTYTVVVTPEA